jgi:hypothetical protein
VKATFDAVLLEHTAGSPMEEGQFWTYLNPREIAEQMELKGIKVSRTVVKKLLKAGGFVRRKSQKTRAMGESKDRNGQFENIKKVVKRHKKKGDAVIRWTQKKEPISTFSQSNDAIYGTKAQQTSDHDFTSQHTCLAFTTSRPSLASSPWARARTPRSSPAPASGTGAHRRKAMVQKGQGDPDPDPVRRRRKQQRLHFRTGPGKPRV